MGQAKIRLGDYDGAIAALTNVIDFPRTDRTMALINRCYAYLQLNLVLDAQRDCSEARRTVERNNAIRSLNEAPQILRDYHQISLNMVDAELLLRSGQAERALEVLNDAASLVEESDLPGPLHMQAYWAVIPFRAEVPGAQGMYLP